MRLEDAAKYAQITVHPQRQKGVIHISAGGPGSGRHPGLHAVLKSHGFSFKGIKRPSGNSSYMKGKQHVITSTDGSWTHFPPKGEDKDGEGTRSLDKHLGGLKGEVKAGGPGEVFCIATSANVGYSSNRTFLH